MSNPFDVERGRPELVKRLARPSTSQPAFADLSPEALAIAQQWHDERSAHVAKMQEITARLEQDADAAAASQRDAFAASF